MLSGPLAGLLPVAGPSRSPVNGAGHEFDRGVVLPGVNAGPNTAFGGKGRERPCILRRVDAAAKRQSAIANHKSQISSRKSPIPNPQSLIPCSRGGFTLIEMLVTIGIMLMLVTAAVMIMPSATESRRIREAARGVNIYLSSARNRAMETGCPCGVTFHYIGGGIPCAMNADQCEQSSGGFSGDTYSSTASVTYPGAGNQIFVSFSDGALPNNTIRPGDTVQFNGQGPLYTIAPSNPVDGNGYLKGVGTTTQPLIASFDTSQGQIVPWGTTPLTVTFSIRPSPTISNNWVKGVATPLQLPATTVVDLDFSSASNGLGPGMGDLIVMFSSTGAVASVNGLPVTDPVYILIGRRERVGTYTVPPTPPAVKANTDLSNAEDLNNLWVTINAQTGAINTEPVAFDSGGLALAAYNSTTGSANDKLMAAKIAAMNAARGLATQGIGMGGK